MKICVISTPIFALGGNGLTGYGGLEQIAWLTARGLAQLGHQVALVAPEGSMCPGVQMISNGPAGQWDENKAYSTYWQHLLNFDVIIDESWQKHAYMLKIEGRLKAPVLGVCHAPIDTMYKQLPQVEKPCMVCISEDQRTHFESLFNRPARTAYNGIDLNFYKPLNIPRSDRFLFLARFSTIKGPDLAIEACLKAGVGLDLVGDTSITNEPEFLAKCKQMVDGKQIRFVGPATRGECVWWFSQAKALLHPVKRFREPFGLAPVEAMACGCPVIAWDNGACRETISVGWNYTNPTFSGWLVDSEESLLSTINDVKQIKAWETIPQTCRKQAEKFSVERMAKRYSDLCLEAVQTGGW